MRTKECIYGLYKFCKGYRLQILINALTGMLSVLFSLLIVFVSKKLVDIVTGSSDSSLIHYISLLIFCFSIQICLSYISTRLECIISISAKNSIRSRLFNHLMGSLWNGKEKYHTGDVINRLENDVRIVSDIVSSSISDIISTGFQLIASFIFLLFLDAKLAYTLLIIMPFAILLSKAYIKRMRSLNKKIRTSESGIQSHVQEQLQHRLLILSLEKTNESMSELTNMQTKLFGFVKERMNFSLLSRETIHLGFMIGYVVTFLWCILGIKNGTVTFGMMTAFLQLVSQIQHPCIDLSHQIPGVINSLTSVERLYEISNLPIEKREKNIQLESKNGISFENVSFKYPDSTDYIFKGFTYDFKPGTSTTIVGETGVGKSTLIRLILSILSPCSGKINIYNKDIEANVSPSTRCNIIYVPQGNTLLSGTIRDNLLLGNPNANDDELKRVLHIAAADFVFKLDNGLNTICGESGKGLSEGQCQRISIARSLLRKGSIIIMDEPTSSLDSETESLLIKRLNENLQDKTMIIITHREKVINHCDNVLTIKKTII